MSSSSGSAFLSTDANYNIERLLKHFASAPHKILLCGTCTDARGLAEADLMDGARRSTMDEFKATDAAG